MPILALLLQTAAPTPPQASWVPVVSDDRASGRHSISAAAVTADGAARLVVRCDKLTEGVVSVQIVPRERLSGRGVQPVALQFDGATAMIDNWELMGPGAIERVDGAVTTLTSGIAHAKAITVRTINGADQPAVYTFTGPASDAPIREVLATCGYVLGQTPARAEAPAAAPSPTPTPSATPIPALTSRRRRKDQAIRHPGAGRDPEPDRMRAVSLGPGIRRDDEMAPDKRGAQSGFMCR